MTPPVTLDATNRRLLQAVQDDFPLDRRPWRALGERLGLPETEVLERIRRMTRDGVIRSIGPVVEAKRVGLAAATLAALRVPEARLPGVARMVAAHPGVSHCYERDHAFNLWFTLSMPDEASLDRELRRLFSRARVKEDDRLNLPVVQRFKVDVRFQLAPPEDRA